MISFPFKSIFSSLVPNGCYSSNTEQTRLNIKGYFYLLVYPPETGSDRSHVGQQPIQWETLPSRSTKLPSYSFRQFMVDLSGIKCCLAAICWRKLATFTNIQYLKIEFWLYLTEYCSFSVKILIAKQPFCNICILILASSYKN